jgi:hypothetical protein
MTVAPPEKKQHLTCENRVPAHQPWPAAPGGAAEAEISRLQQQLGRAERAARTARGWAWTMFGFAVLSVLAVALLAARLGQQQVDERSGQALLDLLAARRRHGLPQEPAPAPLLPPPSSVVPAARPAPVQTGADQSVASSAASNRLAPGHPSPAPSARPRPRTPEIAPLPPAASSFAPRPAPHRPDAPRTNPAASDAATHPKAGQPAGFQRQSPRSAVHPTAASRRTGQTASVAGRSARGRGHSTLARHRRHAFRSRHRYSGWRGISRHYRRTWRSGRHYRYGRRSARARYWLTRGRRGHAGYSHWSRRARRHHFRRSHHRTANRHSRAPLSPPAGSAGSVSGAERP